jgi:hypothetical protein
MTPLRNRFGFAFRALLVALWAISAAFAPAHAAADALNDPCAQVGVSAPEEMGGDPDEAFHERHDCGTCHAHVLFLPASQALKAVPRVRTALFADAKASPAARADGPFRPPRA